MTTDQAHEIPTGVLERAAEAFASVVRAIESVVQGKSGVVHDAVLCLVAGGHLLIEDVPGVGKTTIAKALAAAAHLELGRIQFTPDLLPSDVTGVSVWNRNDSSFTFRPGPVFSQVVLADEINRASPKTQAALLEAMAEQQVTVDGTTHALPDPHMVVATQNPVEQEGTYPLPESQLDRFLMRLRVGYPERGDELDILRTHERPDVIGSLGAVISPADVARLQTIAATVAISDSLRGYLIDLADATRRHPAISLGMSPRATLAVQRVARAQAASNGRGFVTDDDIRSVAVAVVAHRLIPTTDAMVSGQSAESIMADILNSVPVPRDRR